LLPVQISGEVIGSAEDWEKKVHKKDKKATKWA
jgi:hypothetical protein